MDAGKRSRWTVRYSETMPLSPRHRSLTPFEAPAAALAGCDAGGSGRTARPEAEAGDESLTIALPASFASATKVAG